jgi:hypothetical protein
LRFDVRLVPSGEQAAWVRFAAAVNPLTLPLPSGVRSRDRTKETSMSDPKNTQGTPGPDEEADTASGGAPDAGPDTEEVLEAETTDENGKPLENPSGG